MAKTKKAKISQAPTAQAVVKPYSISIKILGKVFESSGDTVEEALLKLPVKNAKGRSIITVEHDGLKKERIFMPPVTFRLFNTIGITKDIAIKQIAALFQGL